MALSFLYLMTRRLVGMVLGSLRGQHAKYVEIAVLRHQLSVLRRQIKRPEFRPADRAGATGVFRVSSRKLGVSVSATAVRTVLLRNGLGRAPRRASVT